MNSASLSAVPEYILIDPGNPLSFFAFLAVSLVLGIFTNQSSKVLAATSLVICLLISPAVSLVLLLAAAVFEVWRPRKTIVIASTIILAWIGVQVATSHNFLSVSTLGLSFSCFRLYSLTRTRMLDRSSTHTTSRSILYLFFPASFVSGPLALPGDYFQPPQCDAGGQPMDLLKAFERFILGFLQAYFAGPFLLGWLGWGESLIHDSRVEAVCPTVFGYYLLLYFNFNGYTKMAIACGQLCGIRLPENFINPFRATSFSEFWTRQHASLTAWLRDQVFMPLRLHYRSKVWGPWLATVCVIAIGSFWHSIGFGVFVFFGIQLLGSLFFDRIAARIPKAISWLITQSAAAISVFAITAPIEILHLVIDESTLSGLLPFLIGFLLSALTCWAIRYAIDAYSAGESKLRALQLPNREIKLFFVGFILACLFIYSILGPSSGVTFIYSRF